MKILLAFLPLVMLAACTTAIDDPFLTASTAKTAKLDAPALATSMPAGQAIASLPGHTPVAVRQSMREHVVEQTILYPNPRGAAGENALSITVAAAGADPGGKDAPSRAKIEAEMRDVLPGLAMRIDPTIGDNAYGAFGTATGPFAGSGGCLYAWQVVRRLDDNGETGFAGLSRSGYSARLRLRYCDAATPPERLAAMMQGLRIRPIDSRTFEAMQRTTEIAMPAPMVSTPVIAPVMAAVDADLAPSMPRRIVRAPEHVAQASPVAAQPQPVSNAVKVPLPGGSAQKAAVSPVSMPPKAAPPATTMAVGTPPATASPVRIPLPGGNADL